MTTQKIPTHFRWLSWLPVIVLTPFLALFLFTSLSRIAVPFELEWNEGQNAVLALRFAEGLPLYPDKESGWVPYIYAPGYHQAFGFLMSVTGIQTLSLGRLISFLSTIAIILILIEWITLWSGRIEAGLLSGFLYLAYFEPSGFFYDLVRNDSLTWALALLGISQIIRKDPKPWNYWLGFVALALGTWTKQPVIVFWFLAGIWILFKGEAFSKVALLTVSILFLNLLVFYPRLGEPEFFHYVVKNALAHADDSTVFQSTVVVNPSSGLLGFFESRVWSVGIIPVFWLQVFPLIGAVILFIKKRFALLGISTLLYGASFWASLSAYQKFGGYQNNWMPLFLANAVVCGLVYGQIISAFSRIGNLKSYVCISIGTTLILLAQNIPHLYNPKEQIPDEADHRAHRALQIYLQDKSIAEETVWVLHHQWYGIQTGHPMSYNSDMVRCASYANDWPPNAYYEVIEQQRFDWVIMNSEDIDYEWLPTGAMDRFLEKYDPIARLDEILDFDNEALMPVTGAPTRPWMLYRMKSE